MRIHRLSLATALASAAALPGCDFDILGECKPSGPGADGSVPEVHGSYVSSATVWTANAWSPSGEEVTFVSADLRIAYAHHVQSGAARQLYASNTPGERIVDAQLSADGVDWFTTSFNAADSVVRNVIRRHTSAGSTVLTDRGTGGFLRPAEGRGVLVTPGQPVAAFIVLPDSLFLLRRGGEPTLLGSGCTGIVAFSPDESRVLCRDWPLSFQVFRTDGGTAESLVLPAEVAGREQLIRWGAQGIQVLYWGGDHYLLYEQGSGSSRPFTQAANSPEVTWPGLVSWSSDGRKVAYWNHYCAQLEGRSCRETFGDLGSGCRISQAFLYVLDVATGTTTRVAVHTSTPWWPDYPVAVSPTGSMVAYIVNGGFYLLEVR